jgi:hypothetical protein
MLQIYEEENDVLQEKGENYDGDKSEELPPSPPPPTPPPMPPETEGRFNKTAISIGMNKKQELSPLQEQHEDFENTVMDDDMLLKAVGVKRFQSRFHSWPETTPPRPMQINFCRQCLAEEPPRRMSAPVPISVTYCMRVRLRSFSHLLADVLPPRRSHKDTRSQVSNYKRTLL